MKNSPRHKSRRLRRMVDHLYAVINENTNSIPTGSERKTRNKILFEIAKHIHNEHVKFIRKQVV